MCKNVDEADIMNIGSSIAGALVNVAIGGSVGILTGAVITPVLNITNRFLQRAYERKRVKAQRILLDAFILTNLSIENIVELLDNDDEKSDDLLKLLQTVSESDDALNNILTKLLSKTILSESDIERERLLLMSAAIKGMRSTHMRILRALGDSLDGMYSSDLARYVKIPEVELRNTVRDMELRGLIKDVGDDNVTRWEVRELGETILIFIKKS